MRIKNLSILAVFLAVTQTNIAQELGANFNENISQPADTQIFKQLAVSGVTWVRGFVNIPNDFIDKTADNTPTGVNTKAIKNSLDAKKFVSAGQKLGPRVKLAMSMKLEFELLKDGVPVLGSTDYMYIMQAIKLYLESNNMGESISLFALGNEPMWENGGQANEYELFLDAFADSVAKWRDNNGWDFLIFAGSLNRISELPNNATAKAVIKIAKNNPNIDGLDLHVHAQTAAQAENDIKYIRENQGFTKKIITTEFSVVWLFSEKLDAMLGSWGSTNGFTATTTVLEYLNHCMLQAYNGTPVSSGEFLSMFQYFVWYPDKWYKTFYDAFKKYDAYALIGRFTTEVKNIPYTLESTMWDLGAIYSGTFAGANPETGLYYGSPIVYPEFKAIRDSVYPNWEFADTFGLDMSGKMMFHYDFENTLIDKSVNKLPLFPYNKPNYTDGKYGQCIQLNGTSDYFDFIENGLVNTGEDPFTIAAWVNSNTTENGNYNILHQLEGRIALMINNSNTGSTLGTWIGGAASILPGNNLSANKWEHVAIVCNPINRTHKYYINGVYAGETVSNFPFEKNSDGFRLGAHKNGSGGFFSGKIDELYLYRALLTEVQINKLMNNEVVEISSVTEKKGKYFTVFPNPAKNNIQVVGNNILGIALYNLEGNLIKTSSQPGSISTSNIQDGFYLLQITTNKGTLYWEKVLIIH